MIARGDNRHARPQQIDRDLRRDAASARGVLPIDDHKIDPTLLFPHRYRLDNRPPAGLADNIAKEKELQHAGGISMGRVEVVESFPRLMLACRPVRIFAAFAALSALAAALAAPVVCAAPLAPTTISGTTPHLSALATEPDWKTLNRYHETITQEEFTHLLDAVYAPGGAWKDTIQVTATGASILASGTARWLLRFSTSEEENKRAPRYWHPLYSLPAPPASRPLAGLTIALDPGHLGGKWAKMEERWFQIGDGTTPVAEGDMTLLTSRLVAARLRARGARVLFVRDTTEPLTKLRPDDLRAAARAELQKQGLKFIRDKYGGPADELRMNSIQWASELLFYRTAEIQARARRVNETLHPDLVLCLHYNAEAWGDPKKPTLPDTDHMHLLVNGNYSAAELKLDDVRYDMLMKLLSRTYEEELPVAEHIATSLAQNTGLPPYKYTSANAMRVGDNPYIWARNLLANRLYDCPVIYIEPYVMNSPEVWDRVQAGNYEGRKFIHGKNRESIYQEYANAVTEGLTKAVLDTDH